ncbi:MAG TPA: gliding motility-associated C-terminal domain-containing protein [Saprospiraceae bacterium]|nr:gliding motility-associated C-terminal domain-containing protein [Saprospiraceae bacterium]
MPRTGVAYAGMYGYYRDDNLPPDTREYVEGTLSAPLQQDSVYRVEFYVNLAEKPGEGTGGADRMGAYFSKELIKYDPSSPQAHDVMPFKPQVDNLAGRILGDTAHWMPVCGYFRASGGERYIIIGNFHRNAQTSLEQLPDSQLVHVSYYFVDDVSVEKVPLHLSPYSIADTTIICRADSIHGFEVKDGLHQILWSTGDTTRQVSVAGQGLYWVRAYQEECLFSDTFQVVHLPAPVSLFVSDSTRLCETEMPLKLESGNCCVQRLWFTGDTSPSTWMKQAGWGWVEEKNSCGALRDSLYVSLAYRPDLDLGLDTALCDTSQFYRSLYAPPGMDMYRWSTGDSVATVTIDKPGVYWALVQNSCGVFVDTLTVQDLHDVRLRVSPDTVFCLSKPIQILAEPLFDSYQWSNGEITSQIWIERYGTYNITVTNACGTQTDSVKVIEGNHPFIHVPHSLQIDLGDAIEIPILTQHDKPVKYVWTPSESLSCEYCERPKAMPLLTTTYQVVVTDSMGCSTLVKLDVLVKDADRIYVPNVFSPDDDGLNDKLEIWVGSEVSEILSARVYSRWGEMVAERKGMPLQGAFDLWDGRHRGRAAASGVYVIVLDIRLIDGRIIHKEGDVTLVR